MLDNHGIFVYLNKQERSIMTKQELSSLIREAREEKKLNQRDIADSLFYTTQTISQWESGKSFPKMDAFFRFCQLLGIDINDFLRGTITDTKDVFEYDNRKAISFFISECNKNLIEKTELENKLEVSRPKLQKLIRGEYMLNLFQFSTFLDLLDVTPEEVFTYQEDFLKKQISLLNSIRTERFRKPLTLVLSIGMLLGITGLGHLYLKPSTDVPPIISDDIEDPVIPPENLFVPSVDYSDKCLHGLIIGNTYTIGGKTFVADSETIQIGQEWYDKEIEITDNTLSITKSIFIDTMCFENYFPENSQFIPNKNIDVEDFDSRIDWINDLIQSDEFGGPDSEFIKKDFLLDDKDKAILKSTFEKTIPHYADSYFSSSLFDDTEKSQSQGKDALDYQIRNDEKGNYIEIRGLRDSSIKAIVIPKTIDGISDIRISDKAFSKEKNPDLLSVAFEAKPHFIGDYVFEGLDLKTLDFGIEEDQDYNMECNLKLKSSDQIIGPIYYSDCLNGIIHISKLRPPLSFTGKSYMTFKLLFGRVTLDENTDFDGIDSLFLPTIRSKTPYDYFDYSKMRHCRIYSLYVPKRMKIQLDSTDNDLYLRMVRFESGYWMETEDPETGKIYRKSPFENSFLGYPALEYLLVEKKEKSFSVSERFLNACPFFQGEIQYSNISKLSKSCFKGTSLPSKITLSHIREIKTGAFEGTYGLNEITIENSDDEEVVVYPGSFVNSDSVPEAKRIHKIRFIGFDDRLSLLSGYKDESIEVEFVPKNR